MMRSIVTPRPHFDYAPRERLSRARLIALTTVNLTQLTCERGFRFVELMPSLYRMTDALNTLEQFRSPSETSSNDYCRSSHIRLL